MRRAVVVAVLFGGVGVLTLPMLAFWRAPAPRAESCSALSTDAATQECLINTLTSSGDPAQAATELASAITADRGLNLTCHEAAHAAGSLLYGSVDNLRKFLATPDAQVCDWGLVHGLLAGLVATDPDASVIDSLLDVCVALPVDASQRACGDSVGHALWETESAFAPAVDRCIRVAAPVGDACVSGVFMQFYKPVAPTTASPTDSISRWAPPVSQQEVYALCADLGLERAQSACAAAAYYTYAPDLGDARDVALGNADPFAVAQERFVPLLDAGLVFCAGFDISADLCAKELVRYALQMLRSIPSGDVESLVCSRSMSLDVRNHCHKAARVLL